MKVHHIILIILAVMITFSACREITVTTKVNKDGSFTRIIKITGDSADVFKKDLPYPIDDSWLMEVKRDSVDTSLYVTYTKTYSDSDLLNSEMRTDTGWMSQLDRSIEIRKRFGFFYSYLTFEEVVKAANPFTILDYADYLSPEEMQWLTNKILPRTTSDTAFLEEIEEKADEFLIKSVRIELIQILEEGVNKLADPSIDPLIIQMYSDSIDQKIREWESGNFSFLIDMIADGSGEQKLIAIKQFEPELFSDFNKKADFLFEVIGMHDYNQLVEMPGIITETNSTDLKGNQVSWHVDGNCFLLTDCKMHVESRVVNYWMFALTGFLVLILIIFLVIKAFR